MWEDIAIKNKQGQNLYCRYFCSSVNLGNIIYIQTPLVSVSGISQKVYEPLSDAGYNIYAFDLSSIGKSEGRIETFSTNQIVNDVDTMIDYILSVSNKPIFLYASTGIGGILGQYFVSKSNRICAFAQYGVGVFQDLLPIKIPLWFANILFAIVKILVRLFPKLSIKIPPPTYKGKNKKMEDEFYDELVKESPNIFYTNINWIATLLEMFLAKDSSLKTQPKCPTLVFKPLHDRYFSSAYFDKYFKTLTCEKKLYSIDDVHSSYYFHAEEICRQVSEWFFLHCLKEDSHA